METGSPLSASAPKPAGEVLNSQAPATRRSGASLAERASAGLFICLIAGTQIIWLVFLGWLASRII